MAKSKPKRNKKYNPNKNTIRLDQNGHPDNPANLAACLSATDLEFDTDAYQEIIDTLKRSVGALETGTMNSEDFYMLHRRTLLIGKIAEYMLTNLKINSHNPSDEVFIKVNLHQTCVLVKEMCRPLFIEMVNYYRDKGKWITNLQGLKTFKDVIKAAEFLFPLTSIATVTKAALDTEKEYDKFIHTLNHNTVTRMTLESPTLRRITRHRYA